MKRTLIAAAMLLLVPQAFATPESYEVDTQGMHASINFKINHLGYSWIVGRFNDFKGSFVFDEDEAASNSVVVTINTASVDSNHAERDRHVRGKDFLNVKKFPEASFNSTGVTKRDDEGSYKVQGDLTLHGVTKQVEFDIEEVGAGNDPWGGFRRGFVGEMTLKPSDFGINYDVGPAAATLELQFILEGIKQ